MLVTECEAGGTVRVFKYTNSLLLHFPWRVHVRNLVLVNALTRKRVSPYLLEPGFINYLPTGGRAKVGESQQLENPAFCWRVTGIFVVY